MITPELSILNQKGTPMFNSDLYANRPPFGIAGRIFISTDTKEFYRDTGSAWELIGGPGSGTVTGSGTATQVAFWNSASSLTGTNNLYWDATNNRLGINTNTPGVSLDVHGTNVIAQLNGTGTTNAQVTFQNAGTNKWQIGNIHSAGSNYFRIQDNASNVERIKLENTGSYTLLGYQNIIRTETATAGNGFHGLYSWDIMTIPASTTFTNNGNSFGSIVGRSNMTYQGSATFGNANVPSAILGTNIFDFSTGAGTINISQGTGTRTFSALTAFNQVNSPTIGTITHLSSINVLAPYSQSGTMRVTNYYGLLINNSDERSAFTITNRWGIYQEGAFDPNYFAGVVLIGTNSPINNGSSLQVGGNATFNGTINVSQSYLDTYMGTISQNNTTTDRSFGLLVRGGTSANDVAFRVQNAASNTNLFTIAGNGATTFSSSITAGSPISVKGATPFFRWLDNADTRLAYIQHNASNLVYNADTGNHVFNQNLGIGTIPLSGGGLAKWITLDGLTYGGGLISSVSGVAKGYLYFDNNTNSFAIQGASGVPFTIQTGGNERMRINSSGNFLLNTSVIGVGSSIATIRSNSGGQGALAIQNSSSVTKVLFLPDETFSYQIGLSIGTNGNYAFRFEDASSNFAGGIIINASSVLYTSVSDYRVKYNLSNFDGLELINKIPIYKYNLKDSRSDMYGVLAHELKDILDYAVTGDKDGSQLQSVDYTKIIPIIVKAIQELNNKIN